MGKKPTVPATDHLKPKPVVISGADFVKALADAHGLDTEDNG